MMENLTSTCVTSACLMENLTSEDVGDLEPSELVETIKWVAYSVVAYVIVGVGLLGNLTSLVVLTRPNLKVRHFFAKTYDIIN